MEYPPAILGDHELLEQSIIKNIMERISQKRKNILGKKDVDWIETDCDNLFWFLKDDVYYAILEQHVFLSSELADLFQAFCDFRKEYLEHMRSEEPSRQITLIHIAKMKCLALQLMDEIIKEMFRMDDDAATDFDEDEDSPAKQLYKHL